MGITGLTSFMDDNLHLLKEHRLQQTKIVIDGNNLYHLLYYDYNVDCIHGGDYDKFAAKTKEFFCTLSSCRITPYVVFDGGYEIDDRKLRTVLQRNQQRLINAHSISKGGHGKILPILAYETFRQALIESHVCFVVSDFEADYDIAVLANDLKCPVLSYDSDFYIFPLTAGFIPFDSVNFEVQTQSENPSSQYLLCRIYFVESLTRQFPSLGKDVLPLLATLMGNDYIEPGIFEVFLSKIPTPKENDTNFKIAKFRTRMLKYMHWLKSIGSLQEARDTILLADKSNSELVQQKFDKSMEEFTLKKDRSACRLAEFCLNAGATCSTKEITGYEGCQVPHWIAEKHRTGEVVTAFKNVLLLRRQILQCQVEEMKSPSSYACSTKIRQVTYGILTSELDLSQSKSIIEYDREMKNVKKNHITASNSDLTLSVIPVTDLEKRRGKIFDSLEISMGNVLNVSLDMKVLVGVLLYWVFNSNPKIKEDHLKAILTCIIFLQVKFSSEILQKDSTKGRETMRHSSVSNALMNSTSKQIDMFIKNLSKFCGKPEHTKKHPMDIDTVHAFSQFQTCLLAAIHLNQLLLCPFPTPNPAFVFKGVFVYNLSQDLHTKGDSDKYLADLFLNNSPLHCHYLHLLYSIKDCIETNKFLPKIPKLSLSKKKKSKSKRVTGKCCLDNVKVPEGNSTLEVCTKEESDDDSECIEFEATCSLGNRFAALRL